MRFRIERMSPLGTRGRLNRFRIENGVPVRKEEFVIRDLSMAEREKKIETGIQNENSIVCLSQLVRA